MSCRYPARTWSVLVGMIATGAARSIAVKLAYQGGFRAPLTITLLYLLGQALSLGVHGARRRCGGDDYRALSATAPAGEGGPGPEPEPDGGAGPSLEMGAVGASKTPGGDGGERPHREIDGADSPPTKRGDEAVSVQSESTLTGSLSESSASAAPTSASPSSDSSSLSLPIVEFYAAARASFFDGEMPNGSSHGLSGESEERIRWAHRVPFYAKPAIPAVLNLLNSALRWASLVYIDASVAEMLISGLELTLSVVAARVFRKRMVARSRWAGVVVVAAGVLVIERANNSRHRRSAGEAEGEEAVAHGGARTATIGVILIILQSMLSVLQDLGEEIFMQATDFPAAMMLGMEGSYGFFIGLIIYSTLGNELGIEDVDATINMLGTNAKLRWWAVGLPFLFLVTGIFNIEATAATSAMTRNVWKNLRTVLVWAVALGIFYLGGDDAYGEAWHTPESFVILIGFAVMSAGIVLYYSGV